MNCFIHELVQGWYVLPLEPDMIYLIMWMTPNQSALLLFPRPPALPFPPLLSSGTSCSEMLLLYSPTSFCFLLFALTRSHGAQLQTPSWTYLLLFIFFCILGDSEDLSFAVIPALLLLSVLLRRWPCLPAGFKAFHYFLFKSLFKANFHDKCWPNNDNVKDSENNILSLENKTRANTCNVYKMEHILTVTLTCSSNSELHPYLHISLTV